MDYSERLNKEREKQTQEVFNDYGERANNDTINQVSV